MTAVTFRACRWWPRARKCPSSPRFIPAIGRVLGRVLVGETIERDERGILSRRVAVAELDTGNSPVN